MATGTSNHHEEHHEPHIFEMEPREITRDVLARTTSKAGLYWQAVGVLAVLFILGVVGFVMRLGDDRTHWGYYAAMVAFLFTTAQTAPMVSIATRFVKSHWRRPLARPAEMWTVVGIYNLILFIPLMLMLPPVENRLTIWIEARAYVPHIADTAAMVGLMLCGLGLLWATAMPDFAAGRARGRGGLFRFLARDFDGTVYQWKRMRVYMGLFSALYFMWIIFTHYLFSADFSMAMLPGWVDAIYPTYHALSGLQSAVATMLVTLFVLRRFGGYHEYISMEVFWGLSKLLLALSLLWFYFFWSAFITLWYGRQEIEQHVIELIFFGPYRPIFVLTFLFNFVFAVGLLIWNPIRKNPAALAGIGTMVLVGTLLDRIRLYVGPWSIENVQVHEIEAVPAAMAPGLPDIFIIAGGIAGAILTYLLAARVVPNISIWEMKELRLYEVPRYLLRLRVKSLGKPE